MLHIIVDIVIILALLPFAFKTLCFIHDFIRGH